jgi:hypothetical protein
MGLTDGKGVPIDRAAKSPLAMVQGAKGREQIENPFLDESSRSLFEYLHNSVKVSMLYNPTELKAIHESQVVAGFLDATPNSKWVGYIQNRGGNTSPKDFPPSRN